MVVDAVKRHKYIYILFQTEIQPYSQCYLVHGRPLTILRCSFSRVDCTMSPGSSAAKGHSPVWQKGGRMNPLVVPRTRHPRCRKLRARTAQECLSHFGCSSKHGAMLTVHRLLLRSSATQIRTHDFSGSNPGDGEREMREGGLITTICTLSDYYLVIR